MIGMPRFPRRRTNLKPPDNTAVEVESSPEADAIEQEIMAEEAERLAAQRRVGSKWVPWMTPLWVAGCLITLLMLAAASKSAVGAFSMGLVSIAVNGTASYAIRKGGTVAPRRFPVTYSSNSGKVNGANFALLLVFLGLLTAWLGFDALFL